jgi:peptidoglycan-associated lipoprotein
MPEPRIEEPVVEPKVEQKLDLRAVYFDYDKFNVRDDQKARLTDDAEMLIKFPSSKVELQGHCDERGTEEYNVALGQKRARAVYDFLTQYGISANRLVAKTYGEERPTCSDHNEDCWWRNRRVEFIVVQ